PTLPLPSFLHAALPILPHSGTHEHLQQHDERIVHEDGVAVDELLEVEPEVEPAARTGNVRRSDDPYPVRRMGDPRRLLHIALRVDRQSTRLNSSHVSSS